MAFIEIIHPDKATGMLKRVYDEALERAGRVFNVLRIMSCNPGILQASMGMYMATMHSSSKLSRTQREMIATVVSRTNNCYY